ncbi:MAG: TetR/AcrR family transcriptional regulator [Acidimicrobiales bacterium]
MGYKYDEDEILDAAVDAVLEEGLSALTFGRLAKRLGIADRSIVYYFPTKAELVTRTTSAVGSQLQAALARAFGDAPLPGDELMRRAWPVLSSPDVDPLFAVFFELVGLGAASIPPYDALAPALMEAWIQWLVPRIDAPEEVAWQVASATVATLDGLLLLRHTCGPDAADAAARHFGIARR